MSKPASSEPGLLVASSSSGQITYWETISNAEIMGLIRQKQNGIQGVVPGMFSGEIITDLACAEPAGFILSFSSGRVAQLAVRDSQGRPAISVRFLQGGNRSATGGILGGIRNVLSGSSWKKGIASVKASESHSRGQRDVTIVSLTGAIEVWDMHWSNGPSLKYRAEAGRATLDALRKERLIGDTQTEESLTVLDFATDFDAEHSTELALASYQQAIPLLLLVAAAGEKTTSYSLVEIAVTGREVSISSVLPINTYTSPVDPEPAHRPRLAVLKKGAMAFVTFARAICLVSLASVEPSPSSQLLQETSFIPTAFQDCIHFREDRTYRILGSELEEQAEAHKNGAYLAMVQNFGLIRITLPVTKQSDAKNNTSDPAYRLSAKSRLEQAIFFGSKRDNPLDFVSHEEMDFPENEITHAALAICNEILRSSSSFIPTASPSIEHQLALRAKALHDLAAHLKRHCPPLPRLVKWELLRAGEKLAAQRAIWKTEQEILKRRKTGESTIFNRILWYMHERFKTEVDWDRNENDQVRHWLIYDTWRTEYIVPWFLNVLRQLRIDGPRETATVFENLFQATTLFLAALETGFRFREDNATLYGLGDEPLEDCILLDGYDEQLEFWTSREVAYTEAQKLLDLDIQYCRQFAHSAMADKAKVDQTTVLKLTALLPRAFHVLSLMHTERYRWLLASSNPGAQAKAASERLAFGEKRSEYLFEFGELDLLEEGIELAEKARDMASLVDLVYKINKRDEEQGEQHKEADLVDGKKDRIALYFEKYGELWGDAFFGKQVNDCHLGTLLNSTDSKAHQSHLTRFLQKRPELSSIKWINDICGEHSYEAAAATLETVAFSREINIWNKKVELSLGRLAQLAAWEQSSCQAETPINPETPQYKKFYGQLNLIDIQQMLHEHIQPALHGAIDQKAELELAMDQFGQKVVAGKPMLRRQLEMAFSKLIMSKAMIPEEIVDILTLMDPVRFLEGEDDGDLLGREFFYSLRIVDYSGMRASDPARADAIEQLIWRRCMIRDDWTEINKTELKSDAEVEEVTQSTALFLTIRHCLEDGKSNSIYNSEVESRNLFFFSCN